MLATMMRIFMMGWTVTFLSFRDICAGMTSTLRQFNSVIGNAFCSLVFGERGQEQRRVKRMKCTDTCS